MDIKHGHRFISNHVLGYQFEMQRLIAHERQAHKLVGVRGADETNITFQNDREKKVSSNH